MKSLIVLSASAAFLAGSGAYAAPLAADDFSSYALGTNLAVANGGTGFNGSYSVGSGEGFLNNVRNTNPISYPNYAAVGGNYANLADGFGFGGSNFFQRQVDLAGPFAPYSDGTRVGLDGTTLYGSFAYFNQTANAATGGKFFLQGAANSEFFLPTAGADGLLVFRIDFGVGNADTITFFSNPDLTTFNGSGGTSSNGDFSFLSIGYIVLNGTDNGGDELRVDNIQLGATLADVVPIPEPTTLAAMALLGGAMLRRRR